MTKKKKSEKEQCSDRKISVVMREFKAGTLKSGSGQKVTSDKQALAIALNESRKKCGWPPPKKKK